jgi:Mg-chelatase subunit ChlD
MSQRNSGGSRYGFIAWITAAIVVAIFILRVPSCPKEAKASAAQSTARSAAPAKRGTERPFSGSGYVLDFQKDFNPGANAVDDLGLSVVIAVDVSGSMQDSPAGGGEPKYVQAAKALSDIVTFLDGLSKNKAMEGIKLKVGLISFYDKVETLYPLTEMDSAAFQRLKTALGDPSILKPGGKTAIGKTLEAGAEILASSGTVMKSLIVVSDGENTAGTEPEEVLRAINENRNSASTIDYPVYTRGTLVSFVGFDVDSGIYGPLAGEGARVQAAADQAQLKKALEDILVADISKLEAAP